MAKLDPAILAHLEWIGFVRPTGLVVSAPALVRAGAILDRRDAEGQRLLRTCVEERVFDPKEGPVPYLPNFRAFAESVLGWSFSPKGYAGTADSPIPSELEVPLRDYGETLRPDIAVRELEPKESASSWQLVIRILEPGEDFDRMVRGNGQLEASAHGRMERLLRQTGVPAGLLFNGRTLRLVSAPRGESSGWLDFNVADMLQTAGRPISTALRLLLSQARLLSLPRSQRLAALLEDSRKFQNEVSERLAEQVLHGLYELLRGFQTAHDASKGELLRQPLSEHPDEIYRALLTVILRLVFLLYTEERDMLPEDETFVRYYSLAGLYEQLREDAALFPDTMDQRYGAWAQLLVLFRMIHDGAESGTMRLPKRHGVLFAPDRFPFLEGRTADGARQTNERIEPPLVPDGTIYRALEKLLLLDGERISYRALDVEQIGSVYETMMGFRLETATGRSVAIKAQKKQGAPTAVDLEALVREPTAKREKWLQDRTDRKLTDTVKKAMAGAATLEDLHAALLPVIDPAATPDLVTKGAMVLQPSEERRRTGSHYTPRALTEPIVRTTLESILSRLRGADGRPPRPEQVLDLKVCDPAMGSGAFLVEACRQLGDVLVEAWHAHGKTPTIPPDEDEVIFARRLIAQRCLYGVDRNPVAVDLAKMSLWLATLAKDHALTFVDHALRHGDSLVGLSRKQIEAFHWDPDAPRFQAGFETMRVRENVAKVAKLRRQIREADESVSDGELRKLWDEAQFELGKMRLYGDLLVAALFRYAKAKEREKKRLEYVAAVLGAETEQYRGVLEEWRNAEQPLIPFHWEIEFPDVFGEGKGGFDVVVTNPPFVDSETMSRVSPETRNYLAETFASAKGNWDLYVPFIERGLSICNAGGMAALISPNKWLAAPYGSALRQKTKESITSVLDFSGSRAFADAGVAAICSIFCERSGLPSVMVSKYSADMRLLTVEAVPRHVIQDSESWGLLLSSHLRTVLALGSCGLRMRDYVDAHDPFTVSEAYELKDEILEESEAREPSFRVINSGTIDPYISLWGKRELRYLKARFLRPVIRKSTFRARFPRRYDQASQPKIVISGMRSFEAFMDREGQYIAAKSTIVVRSRAPSFSLTTILGLLNSKLIRFFIQESYGALAVDGGINFSGAIIKDLPLPTGFTCALHSVEESVVTLLMSINGDEVREELLNVVDEAVYDAYGISEDDRAVIKNYAFRC